MEQLKTADEGLRFTWFHEQLDDCEFFDAVAQLKLSALQCVCKFVFRTDIFRQKDDKNYDSKYILE